MKRTERSRQSSRISAFAGRSLSITLIAVVIAGCVAGLLFGSCASAPEYPVFPPPMIKTLPLGFGDAFQVTKSVLKEDPRLILHTLDKAGRLVAMEKTSGFIFFRHRTILDIKLESVGPEETKATMSLKAEDYEMGGFTRPAGWYPSANVDTFLGEDILGLIEKRAKKTTG